MDTEQVTFSEIKLSQVQVCFEGSHIGRLERAVGYDENLDFWGLSDKLVERYGRGHDVQTKGLDNVKRWAGALEMDHQRQMQKEKDMQAQKRHAWRFTELPPPAFMCVSIARPATIAGQPNLRRDAQGKRGGGLSVKTLRAVRPSPYPAASASSPRSTGRAGE